MRGRASGATAFKADNPFLDVCDGLALSVDTRRGFGVVGPDRLLGGLLALVDRQGVGLLLLRGGLLLSGQGSGQGLVVAVEQSVDRSELFLRHVPYAARLGQGLPDFPDEDLPEGTDRLIEIAGELRGTLRQPLRRDVHAVDPGAE